jgi:hypothetical protein
MYSGKIAVPPGGGGIVLTIIIDLVPLKGTLSQREAPGNIYLLTGSADVMP